ncbi:hypothetical protein BN7_5808 [Wickerhamomyces ciferrii]|uniref:Uncharacterized protein n=1 Tax=Wickerhamomyces ciferrii (strain ATCC 14091 / BCRC 22168 / CBS 111 / JCM 3599 / NBRC 0793 / NRRL Y-1031 F-60-10) TaxID=1206466 RepID=K0KW67_WICCF|nr:uncharacterized protein BN7_5808 [Wickerhamomyces ciferrii]CCH46217.1 hypothetical protein BN7_5808 [Wickerhamomyces ciferrii]
MDGFNNTEALAHVLDGLKPVLAESVIYPSEKMLDSIHRALCAKLFESLESSFFIKQLSSKCLDFIHNVVGSIIQSELEDLHPYDLNIPDHSNTLPIESATISYISNTPFYICASQLVTKAPRVACIPCVPKGKGSEDLEDQVFQGSAMRNLNIGTPRLKKKAVKVLEGPVFRKVHTPKIGSTNLRKKVAKVVKSVLRTHDWEGFEELNERQLHYYFFDMIRDKLSRENGFYILHTDHYMIYDIIEGFTKYYMKRNLVVKFWLACLTIIFVLRLALPR